MVVSSSSSARAKVKADALAAAARKKEDDEIAATAVLLAIGVGFSYQLGLDDPSKVSDSVDDTLAEAEQAEAGVTANVHGGCSDGSRRSGRLAPAAVGGPSESKDGGSEWKGAAGDRRRSPSPLEFAADKEPRICASVQPFPKAVPLSKFLKKGDAPAVAAAGANHSVLLTTGGKLYRWGVEDGDIYRFPTGVCTQIPLPCIEVCCGRKHTMALMKGGFVMTWGTGYFGQLGHGDNASYRHPRLLRRLDPQRLGERVIQVACGGYHSAVVTDAGRAFAWGFNRYGQCGNGNKDNTVSEPALVDLSDVPPGRLGEVPQVLCGRHHSALVTSWGALYSWGACSFGKLGLKDPEKTVCSPKEVAFFSDKPLVEAAAGDFHMVALTRRNEVFSWGFGAEGQGGHGSLLHMRTPRLVNSLQEVPIKQVVCGPWWSMAVTIDGFCYAWGSADGGWTGLERPAALSVVDPGSSHERFVVETQSFDSGHNVHVPALVYSLAPYRVLQVGCGGGHSLVVAVPRTRSTVRVDEPVSVAWTGTRPRSRSRTGSTGGKSTGAAPSRTTVGDVPLAAGRGASAASTLSSPSSSTTAVLPSSATTLAASSGIDVAPVSSLDSSRSTPASVVPSMLTSGAVSGTAISLAKRGADDPQPTASVANSGRDIGAGSDAPNTAITAPDDVPAASTGGPGFASGSVSGMATGIESNEPGVCTEVGGVVKEMGPMPPPESLSDSTTLLSPLPVVESLAPSTHSEGGGNGDDGSPSVTGFSCGTATGDRAPPSPSQQSRAPSSSPSPPLPIISKGMPRIADFDGLDVQPGEMVSVLASPTLPRTAVAGNLVEVAPVASVVATCGMTSLLPPAENENTTFPPPPTSDAADDAKDKRVLQAARVHDAGGGNGSDNTEGTARAQCPRQTAAGSDGQDLRQSSPDHRNDDARGLREEVNVAEGVGVDIMKNTDLGGGDNGETVMMSTPEYVGKVFSSCRHGRVEQVKKALSEGFDVCGQRDENGNTLIHCAAQNGLRAMCKAVLQEAKGQPLNLQNNRGNTALHYAFAFGFQQLGNYLASKGADDTLVNDQGLTCYEGLSRHDSESSL